MTPVHRLRRRRKSSGRSVRVTARHTVAPKGEVQDPRIGIVMPLAEQRGGAELALLHLLHANGAGPQQPYSLAFLEYGPMVEETIALGYATAVLPAGRLRNPARFVATVLRLRAWMSRQRLEIVLSWMAKAHLYTAPAARVAGLPALWWQHGLPDGHWMDRLATRLPAAGIFACSEAAKAAQLRLWPRRPVQVIYPAADLDRLARPELEDQASVRRTLGVPEDAYVVGIVARLERWKGVHLVLAAAAQLGDHFPNLLVVVVGGTHPLDPAYATWMQQHAEQLGVLKRTIFAGHQTNVPEWMAAMDVMVNASQAEPFGMVIIEAMALGKPVVAVRAGGPAEIIRDGYDGLLIDTDHPRALADAIRRLLSDASLRARLGAQARLRAQDFSMPRLAQNVVASLQRIIQQ